MNSFLIQPKVAEAVLRAGLACCQQQWVDVLDCSVSFVRQRTKLKPEDVIPQAISHASTHYCLIYRSAMGQESAYFELGTRTTHPDGKDYFIYIILTPEDARALIRKFDLKPIL